MEIERPPPTFAVARDFERNGTRISVSLTYRASRIIPDEALAMATDGAELQSETARHLTMMLWRELERANMLLAIYDAWHTMRTTLRNVVEQVTMRPLDEQTAGVWRFEQVLASLMERANTPPPEWLAAAR